ncbi:MAG TPA: AraC family transcriptional regulator [Verrucomicrobiae bacterium]|jgi:AraC-like DNA-binding protein|nr:AraC family transcriptional regulator [Verrucomicrobiae bacterium]
MKVVFQKVISEEGSSFAILDKSARQFRGSYHFHPEYEITLITEGTGVRLVGDNISEFAPGDLVLLGSNLPHQFMSDTRAKPARARAFVVHFLEASLGRALEQLPEMSRVVELLGDSATGLVFGRGASAEAQQIMRRLFRREGLPRFICLLELLDVLATAKDRRAICSVGYERNANAHENQKINRALKLIHEKFDQPLGLSEAARFLNVSRATCNRLFRKSLRKSFKEFLIEVRISHVAKLLLETDRTVLDIATQCGFANLSNFNRQFRQLKGQSPREFRRAVPHSRKVEG